MYGSKGSDMDPKHNVTDPEHWFYNTVCDMMLSCINEQVLQWSVHIVFANMYIAQ